MLWAILVGEKRLVVDGDFNIDGIMEVDLVVLTLCERAADALVGVISLEASRGNAVWEVILRAGVGAA